MIQVNELRIGNYYDHNGEYKQATPNTILEVWEAERTWCKPIEITEEWIKNFGFEFDIFYQRLSNGKICIDWYDKICSLSWCKAHRDDILRYEYPKYVHQLQNLYKALTGEELTIKQP